MVLQAIQPSYGWLFGSRLLGVYDAYRRRNQPALFAELKQRVGGQRCFEHATEALNVLTRMSIVTGKDLPAFDLEDLTDYARARQANDRTVTALPDVSGSRPPSSCSQGVVSARWQHAVV
ncbi:hypothetical protein [Streptomyces sp. NBC_00872]|uniref:hypothetical protein n=1 Tax=Streptomyces sp. NBC_00872 TaxID=2903686 RepID=UPI00386A7666|nr:hypothetical protein OG214_37830 [Streptomyces sp. NBC_00872]